MRVLVTRPEPQATATAEHLAARGHIARKEPLSVIVPVATALPPTAAVDGVLLTSANAVPSLDDYLAKPVYAVGGATAEAARARGAAMVQVAEGDWQSLARLLARSGGPRPGARLLHLSGAEIRGDLGGAVRRVGFGYDRRVVYTVQPRQWLSTAALGMLASGELDAILFFSPAHATIWHRLVHRAAVIDRLFPLRAVVLSAAVAAELSDLGWREVAVAAAPEQASLLDRLDAIRG